MLIASVAAIVPETPPAERPITLKQTSSRSASTIRIALLLPITLVLLYPFVLVAEHLAANADVRATLLERPASTVQIALALAFWAVLLGWPLKRAADALVSARDVSIDADCVHVTETSVFGTRAWTEPVGAYTGLAHNVRASLSGVRHELILAHPTRERSVLIAMAPSFSQAEIDRVAKLLGHAEIPSRELYSVRGAITGQVRAAAGTTLRGAHA